MCTHNTRGHGIGCQAVRTPYIYMETNIQARVEIEISPPNLSEGGSLCSHHSKNDNTMYVFMVYNMLFFYMKVPNQFHFTCPYKNAAYILCILLGIFCTQFARMQL